MTKEKFSKLGKSMGYANEKEIKEFLKDYSDDYEFTDDDFIKLYRVGYGRGSCVNSIGLRSIITNGSVIKTTKHFHHTHTCY